MQREYVNFLSVSPLGVPAERAIYYIFYVEFLSLQFVYISVVVGQIITKFGECVG